MLCAVAKRQGRGHFCIDFCFFVVRPELNSGAEQEENRIRFVILAAFFAEATDNPDWRSQRKEGKSRARGIGIFG